MRCMKPHTGAAVDRLCRFLPFNAENFAAVRDCCQRYIGCLPACGIHPQNAGSAQEDDLKTLRHWLRREATGPHPPVAVGEIGLDFFETKIPPQLQIRYSDAQLKIAAAANLPVILHVRRAVDAILKQAATIAGPRMRIAHAFNESRQQADAFFAKGFCLVRRRHDLPGIHENSSPRGSAAAGSNRTGNRCTGCSSLFG